MAVGIRRHPPGAAHGLDVDEQGNGILAEPRPVSERTFEITFLDSGAQA